MSLRSCGLRASIRATENNRMQNSASTRMAHHKRITLQRAHTHRRNVAKQLTGLKFGSYSRCDGSLRGLNGNAGIGFADQSAAAPATVSGESVVTSHWSPRLREGDGQMTIREPGDLPSVVVTRERIGRGVSIGTLCAGVQRRRGLVRGDVPHAVTRGLSCVTFFSPPPPMCGLAYGPLRSRARVA